MTRLTIEDINDMTELDEIIIHTLSDFAKQKSASKIQESNGLAGDIDSSVSPEPLPETNSDEWINISLDTARSFFGDEDAAKINYLADSNQRFIKKNGTARFLFNRKFLEDSAGLSDEEIKAMESGGKLFFPVAMTIDNIRKLLQRTGYVIPSGWKVKVGQKKPVNNVGAKIWTIKNKKSSRGRHLISVRDLEDGMPMIYKMIKETFK
jgi:hypothetical protein